MRIGLLGGSFNPPHVAHQMICLWALSTARVEQVWLVPCFQHAFNKPLLPFEHREQMCQLMTRAFAPEMVEVCTVERELGGPSRTLDTVSRLSEAHPDHAFSLLIGADILSEKDSWYRFDEIERLVDLVVLGRQGFDDVPGSIALPAVSSTEVRRRLCRREPVNHLLAAEVLDYIESHDLYR